MPLIDERPDRDGPWPVLLALLPATGVLLGGLNSVYGNAATCLGYAALLIALMLAGPPPARFWRRAWPPLLLIAAAWIWAAIGVAGWGGARPVAPDLGGSALIGVAGYAAALLCGAAVGARRIRLLPVIDALLLFGSAGLLFALAMQGVEDSAWMAWTDPVDGRFVGTLGNANAAGAVYAGLATLALARGLRDGGALWRDRARLRMRIRALGYWLTLVLMTGGCVLTASRSGAVLMCAAFAIVLLAGPGRAWRHAMRARPSTALAALGALVIGAAIVALSYTDLLVERFDRLPGEVAVRDLLWRHNWAIAWARPVFGYGIGAFPTVNAEGLDSVTTAQALWMVNSPHNIALRLMIDAGLPYLLLIVAAAAVIAVQILLVARTRRPDLHEVAIGAGVLVITGSSMVDIALEVPALTALMLVWAGLLWGRALARHGDIGVALPLRQPATAERRIAIRPAG